MKLALITLWATAFLFGLAYAKNSWQLACLGLVLLASVIVFGRQA